MNTWNQRNPNVKVLILQEKKVPGTLVAPAKQGHWNVVVKILCKILLNMCKWKVNEKEFKSKHAQVYRNLKTNILDVRKA